MQGAAEAARAELAGFEAAALARRAELAQQLAPPTEDEGRGAAAEDEVAALRRKVSAAQAARDSARARRDESGASLAAAEQELARLRAQQEQEGPLGWLEARKRDWDLSQIEPQVPELQRAAEEAEARLASLTLSLSLTVIRRGLCP